MTDKIEPPQEITFHYIKSNHFRIVHADGAWGGITPRGLLQINLYSERQPIPKQTVYPLEGEKLGTELLDRRQSRDGPVREMEVGAMIDLNTARSLRNWLDEKIAELEKGLEQHVKGSSDD